MNGKLVSLIAGLAVIAATSVPAISANNQKANGPISEDASGGLSNNSPAASGAGDSETNAQPQTAPGSVSTGGSQHNGADPTQDPAGRK